MAGKSIDESNIKKYLKNDEDEELWRLTVLEVEETQVKISELTKELRDCKDEKWLENYKSNELAAIYVQYKSVLNIYENLQSKCLEMLKSKYYDQHRKDRAKLDASFKTTLLLWQKWHPDLTLIIDRSEQLRSTSTVIRYFKLLDQLSQLRMTLTKSMSQINSMIAQRERPAKIRPLIQKCQESKDTLRKIAKEKERLIRPECVSSLSKHTDIVQQFIANQSKWFQYLDETDGKPYIASSTKVHFGKPSTAGKLQIKLPEGKSVTPLQKSTATKSDVTATYAPSSGGEQLNNSAAGTEAGQTIESGPQEAEETPQVIPETSPKDDGIDTAQKSDVLNISNTVKDTLSLSPDSLLLKKYDELIDRKDQQYEVDSHSSGDQEPSHELLFEDEDTNMKGLIQGGSAGVQSLRYSKSSQGEVDSHPPKLDSAKYQSTLNLNTEIQSPSNICDNLSADSNRKTSVKSSSKCSSKRLALENLMKQKKIQVELEQKQRELELKRKKMEFEQKQLEEELELERLKKANSLEKEFAQLELEYASASSRESSKLPSIASFSFHEDNDSHLERWLADLETSQVSTRGNCIDVGGNEGHPTYLSSSLGTQTVKPNLPEATNKSLPNPTVRKKQSISYVPGDNLQFKNIHVPNQSTIERHLKMSEPEKRIPVDRIMQKGNKNVVPQMEMISTENHAPSYTDGHFRGYNFTPPVAPVAYYPEFTPSMKLPKLKIPEFDGDPLQWPEWSGLFRATVGSAPINNSLKMNHLKTLVTGKAKEAIAGMGYTAEMYDLAWDTLVRNFGRPQIIVNAQLKKIHGFPFIKPHESATIIKFAQVISSCVNVLTQFQYQGDLQSEAVLNSALRKLPPDLRSKWLFYTKKMRLLQANLTVFSQWLNEIAYVHDEMIMQFPNSNKDSGKTFGKKETPKNTTYVSNSQHKNGTNYSVPINCPLKDGEHKLWNCPKFKQEKVTERYDTVKKLKLCFSCLGQHLIKDCKVNRTCGVNGCEKRHNRLLHVDSSNDSKQAKSNAVKTNEEQQTASFAKTTAFSGILQLVPITLKNESKSVDTIALCDTGSTVSFVDSGLVSMLRLTGPATTLSLAGIHGTSELKSEKVTASISKTDEISENYDLTFYSHPDIKVGVDEYDIADLKTKFNHLQEVPSRKLKMKDVKVILGQNAYELIRPLEFHSGDGPSPWAVKTKLGWSICGPLPKSEASYLAANTFACSSASDTIAEQIRHWWSLEAYATNCTVSGRSKEDKRALEILENTTKHTGERYEVGLLWATDQQDIPNNYVSAASQLTSLERRLSKNEDLRKRYEETIHVDVANGHVRKLNKEELRETAMEPQWYTPHHPVINPHKPEKVRRVCNAAAKYKGFSLNDKLLTGPDLLQNLIGIIFRFRENRIALSADIEAMFLQVLMPKDDCRFLRFLWRSNPEMEIDVYEYTRHVFGAKSSPTCANFALQQTAIDNKDEFPLVAKCIERNFYMDDFLKSVKTTEEAKQIFHSLVQLLQKGGFSLKKWLSNSKDVMESIPEEFQSNASVKQLEVEDLSSSILGLKWNVHSDTLEVCRGAEKEINGERTQRLVLSFVSSVFDPLGIFAPYTMRMRILLKSIWRNKGQSWDTAISEEECKVFQEWVAELPCLKETSLQRKYFSQINVGPIDLHIFSDASLDAMCMVAYLRMEANDGSAEVAFVMGKSRVAPMKPLSIPRLELQAALYGARLRKHIIEEHDVEIREIFHWTDSVTVL